MSSLAKSIADAILAKSRVKGHWRTVNGKQVRVSSHRRKDRHGSYSPERGDIVKVDPHDDVQRPYYLQVYDVTQYANSPCPQIHGVYYTSLAAMRDPSKGDNRDGKRVSIYQDRADFRLIRKRRVAPKEKQQY